MTVISGDAVDELKDLEDDKIIEKCMECMKGLFPGQVSMIHFMNALNDYAINATCTEGKHSQSSKRKPT